MAGEPASPAPLSVLFVCTGNICRSPTAERLLRVEADRDGALAVSSAGTAAMVGRGIDGPSARALEQLGVDPTGHVARRLTDELLGSADLVLTAETGHRGAVLARAPGLLRRTFTMLEFVRLARADGEGFATGAGVCPADRIAVLAGRRGTVAPPRPGADDLPDPYGRGQPAADACALATADACAVVAAVLEGRDPGGAARTLAW